MEKFAILLIKIYRALSPCLTSLFPLRMHCSFLPSCSEYMEAAIQKKGTLQGVRSGLKRLLRCHPFHNCFDPTS